VNRILPNFQNDIWL